MAIEYGWGNKRGEDKFHIIEADEETNDDTTGVIVCNREVLLRADGDGIDYGAHPRVGTRCVECEEFRTNRLFAWLENCEEESEK